MPPRPRVPRTAPILQRPAAAEASSPRALSPRPWTTPSRCFSPGTSTRGRICSTCSSSPCRAGSAHPDVRRPLAQHAPGAANHHRQLPGARPPTFCGCRGELPGGMPSRAGDPENRLRQRRPGQGPADSHPSTPAFSSGPQRPGHGRTCGVDGGADRAEKGGAQHRPGRGHRLHAQALERTDPVPARAWSPSGQQRLRKGAEEGDPSSQESLLSTRPRTAPVSATCS